MPTLSRPGYTFLGWKVKLDRDVSALSLPEIDGETTVDVEGGKPFEFTQYGNITFIAQWEENTYTVKFDKNSSSAAGTMADQSFTYDEAAKALSKNTFSRVGYTFAGWNTQADGKGTSYADEALVRNLTAEANGVVTLYAQWEANKYTVRFDKNSSSAAGTMADQSFTYDEAAKALRKNAFSRVGYTFAGWNTQADGKGASYADEALVRNLTAEPNGVVTLYAQWNINLYPFVFDSQDGSLSRRRPSRTASRRPSPLTRPEAATGSLAGTPTRRSRSCTTSRRR